MDVKRGDDMAKKITLKPDADGQTVDVLIGRKKVDTLTFVWDEAYQTVMVRAVKDPHFVYGMTGGKEGE